MATLTVFLAPDGPAAGVLDVLTDLSAAGLVADFLWVVDADVVVDEDGEGTRDVPAVRVASGRSSATTVRSALADVDHDRCRLCVVVPVSDGAAVDSAVEQEMSAIVAFADHRIPTTRIRVVVARPGDHTPHHVLARLGWHNVYLAPEDARGPGLPAQLLSLDADPVEVGRHAAPTLAGLVGLWSGVDETPFDHLHVPDGVRAGRAFYRRIDARAVEAELRSRVLSTRAPLPEPMGPTANAVYVADPGRACRRMADKWWEKHAPTLVGPRRSPEMPEPLPTGLRALLGMFFRFVGAVLRNAPYALWQGGLIAVKARIARRVHHVVLGSSDSVYEVVVDGIDRAGRDRRPAGWRRIGTEIQLIDAQLAADGVAGTTDQQLERPDLRGMWDDFAARARDLVDGGKGTQGPLSDGANVGVLRSAADAAAPPSADFPVPPQFTDEVGATRLPVGDVLGAEDLGEQLKHIRDKPDGYTRGPDAERALQDLAVWQDRHRPTYSAQVGGILARRLRAMIEEIRAHLRFLAEAADTLEPINAPSRGRVWATRLLALAAVIGLVVAPVLAVRDVVPVRWALVIGILPVVLWLVVVIWGFVRESRDMFRDLNRRRELMSKVEAVRANLRQATIDHGRLHDAYEQYLAWSRVVGAVLDQPFGPPPKPAAVGADITYGLPRTTRIARAEVDEHTTGDAAEALRADLFRIGWLGEPWKVHLGGAGDQLGSHQLRARPRALLDLRGGTTDSYLRRWADLLADPRRGPSGAAGEQAWTTVRGRLRGPYRQWAERLFSSVREVGPGEARAVGLDDFLCGVHLDGRSSGGQEFAAAHFTSLGRTQTALRGRVDVHAPMHASVGLSRVDVLVQLTEAMVPFAFVVTAGARPPEPPPTPAPRYPNDVVPAAGPGDAHEEVVVREPSGAPEAPLGFQ